MPSGRTKYDAAIFGRSTRSTANGSPLSSKVKTSFHASPGCPKEIYNTVDNIYEQENDKDRYLITYADLITLLLGLFIILYASSNIDLNKYQKIISSINQTFGGSSDGKVRNMQLTKEVITPDLKSKVQDLVASYGYKDYITVEQNERGVIIHILDDILFESGNAEIKSSSSKMLERISTMLKSLSNDIRIEGHTDNVPINNSLYASNWHLSVSRALNTAYYLINNENLPADRVSIVGYSEYKPIADNNSEAGRKINRRVDIVIIKK